jgi:transposase-like protein
VVIAGRQFWLWRAVDDEGEVLDLLVQRRRDKAAAVKLMRKLLKKFRTRCAGDRQASLLRRGKVRDRIVGAP